MRPGEQVKKGDAPGLSFGGSTLCLAFGPGAIGYHTLRAPPVGDPHAGPSGSIDAIVEARQQIATAK